MDGDRGRTALLGRVSFYHLRHAELRHLEQRTEHRAGRPRRRAHLGRNPPRRALPSEHTDGRMDRADTRTGTDVERRDTPAPCLGRRYLGEQLPARHRPHGARRHADPLRGRERGRAGTAQLDRHRRRSRKTLHRARRFRTLGHRPQDTQPAQLPTQRCAPRCCVTAAEQRHLRPLLRQRRPALGCHHRRRERVLAPRRPLRAPHATALARLCTAATREWNDGCGRG